MIHQVDSPVDSQHRFKTAANFPKSHSPSMELLKPWFKATKHITGKQPHKNFIQNECLKKAYNKQTKKNECEIEARIKNIAKNSFFQSECFIAYPRCKEQSRGKHKAEGWKR
jgi:hypothetical protein